jgi:hypothetical protein
VLLLAGWALIPFVFYGGSGDLFPILCFWSHFGSFVIGISSFDRLGAISAGLSVLTMIGWLALANGLMGAG